jgi:competence protein ComGC
MALRGTLRDFGLSDIFQLISHQRKTGTLYLEDKGKRVAVTFDEGKVVGADIGTEKTHEKERVGDILLKSGIVEHRQLDEALQEQSRTMKKLGVVLIDKGYITQELFERALAFQIKETLFKIFQWSSGTYRFDAGKVSYDKQFISPFPAEFILMEAARVIDEWPGIKTKVPTLDMVFVKIPGSEEKIMRRSMIAAEPEQEQDDFDLDGLLGEEKPKAYEGDKNILTDEQERVFDLVDGENTVAQMAYKSLLGDFEVSKALVDLLGFGLIKPSKVPVSTPRTEETTREKKSARGILAMVATLVATALFVVLIYNVLIRSGDRLNLFSQMTWERAKTVRGAIASAQIKRLELAIETYRLEKGSYPTMLEDLVQTGYVLESDITYPYSQLYILNWTEKGPRLTVPEE